MGLGFLLAFLPHSAPLSAVRLFHDSGLTLNLALTFFSFFFLERERKGERVSVILLLVIVLPR